MASRKRKSTTSRPQPDYDTKRFTSEEAWNRYADNVLGWNILPKRNVKVYIMEFDEFKRELERRNLHNRLTNLADSSIDVAVVKEFYENLYDPEDNSPKQVRVRGHLIKFDVDTLNTFLETPVVLERRETIPTYSRFCRLRMDPQEIATRLCIPAPTSHTSDLNLDTARLGFPALIIALCKARGVTSDSLSYQSLSPAINLAYIKKNCWNLDEPSVYFPGTRKARARAAEILSSSTPQDPPVPTSAPPPAPTHQGPSTDLIMAMLKSLYQGRYLLMQNFQNLAQHHSFISLEEFTRQVACPGAQPSPIGGPFIYEADPGTTLEETQEVATPEITPQQAVEPSTPVLDLSSPQPSQKPSTPVLGLSSPTTSPAGTLVLHLTDEEEDIMD
ncbi:hypothetical protein GmHk_20G057136 [Glycine max]|nr:hypothetical protein GmHk_20G057136 [Glycine max]